MIGISVEIVPNAPGMFAFADPERVSEFSPQPGKLIGVDLFRVGHASQAPY